LNHNAQFSANLRDYFEFSTQFFSKADIGNKDCIATLKEYFLLILQNNHGHLPDIYLLGSRNMSALIKHCFCLRPVSAIWDAGCLYPPGQDFPVSAKLRRA